MLMCVVEDSDNGDGVMVVRSVRRGGGWVRGGHGRCRWCRRVWRREGGGDDGRGESNRGRRDEVDDVDGGGDVAIA